MKARYSVLRKGRKPVPATVGGLSGEEGLLPLPPTHGPFVGSPLVADAAHVLPLGRSIAYPLSWLSFNMLGHGPGFRSTLSPHWRGGAPAVTVPID